MCSNRLIRKRNRRDARISIRGEPGDLEGNTPHAHFGKRLIHKRISRPGTRHRAWD
jgi:hypothetical protein